MSRKVRPWGERLLVKRNDPPASSTGGIIIPDTAREKPVYGEVLAVGYGIQGKKGVRPHILKAGDKILFTVYAGTEVTHDGEKHLLMTEDDVLAIVE